MLYHAGKVGTLYHCVRKVKEKVVFLEILGFFSIFFGGWVKKAPRKRGG
jgi:hypothetical protein